MVRYQLYTCEILHDRPFRRCVVFENRTVSEILSVQESITLASYHDENSFRWRVLNGLSNAYLTSAIGAVVDMILEVEHSRYKKQRN